MIARLIRKHRRVKINFILLSPPLYTPSLSLYVFHGSSLSLVSTTRNIHVTRLDTSDPRAFTSFLPRSFSKSNLCREDRVEGRRRERDERDGRSTFNYGGAEKINGGPLPFSPRILSLRRGGAVLTTRVEMWRYLAGSAVPRDRASQSKIKKFKRPIY